MSARPPSPTDRTTDLLRHAAWLEQLAKRLVPTPSTTAADDVAQETWLAALRHETSASAAAPGHTSARGWLARVARNFATETFRSDGARRRRETFVATTRSRAGRDADAPTADIVERAELQRLLVDAVLRLDEPYRRTILRRYFDGDTAEAIAQDESTSSSTIRNRIRRGLARLRADLEPRLTDRDGRGLAALAPLAWPSGGAALAATNATAAAAAASTTTSKVTAATLLMTQSTKLVAAAAVVLTLVAGAVLWGGDESIDATPPTAADAALPPTATAAIPPTSIDAREIVTSSTESPPAPVRPTPVDASPTAAAEAPPPPPPPSAGTLVVEARRGDDPLGGHWLHLQPTSSEHWLPPDPWSDDTIRHERTGADGRVTIHGLEPGSYTLGFEFGTNDVRQRTVKLTETTGRHVLLRFGGESLHGTVWSDDGSPVRGARVSVAAGGWQAQYNAFALTAADGTYRIKGLEPGVNGVTVYRSGSRYDPVDAMRLLQIETGTPRRFDVGSPRGILRWRGRVVARTGEPVLGGGRLHISGEQRGYVEGRVEPDGSFDLALTPDTYRIRLDIRGPSFVLADGLVVTHDRRPPADLVLPGARLVLTVRDANGTLVPADRLKRRGSARLDERTDTLGMRGCRVAGDGQLVADGLEAGTWTVHCRGATDQPTVVVGPNDARVDVALTIRE